MGSTTPGEARRWPPEPRSGWFSSPIDPPARFQVAIWFKQHTTSPLAPFLYVFIAQRQRAAFELLAHEKNVEGMKAAAKKYRAFMQRARTADSLIALVADDMDGLPYLYRDVGAHPRTYDPDG